MLSTRYAYRDSSERLCGQWKHTLAGHFTRYLISLTNKGLVKRDGDKQNKIFHTVWFMHQHLCRATYIIPKCWWFYFSVSVLLFYASFFIDSPSVLFMFVYCAARLKNCLLLLLSNAMKGAFITICLQVKGENGDKWGNCTMMNREYWT